ncbi:hypothetical protein ACIBSR_13565 [Streptomyces sp. NPDC049936]|uniref:hypothetical protein n=1 Tax=Streptomyces sp. NPDC049936 TaxID=3365599 RepID=UPI003797EDDB
MDTRADIDDGTKPGTTSQESAELQQARRRIKLPEQETEVLRRAAAICRRLICRERHLSAREGELAGDGMPDTVTCRVLKLARQPHYRWLDKPVTDAVLEET